MKKRQHGKLKLSRRQNVEQLKRKKRQRKSRFNFFIPENLTLQYWVKRINKGHVWFILITVIIYLLFVSLNVKLGKVLIIYIDIFMKMSGLFKFIKMTYIWEKQMLYKQLVVYIFCVLCADLS